MRQGRGSVAHATMPWIPEGVIDDADGDIAALVYAPDQRPDLVLCEFVRYLRAQDLQVCGLIQFRDHAGDQDHRRLLVFHEWRRSSFVRCSTARNVTPYHIDGQWLDGMALRVHDEIRHGVDAVVASRFGPLEMAGRGFCNVIKLASETQTPLVIAVPQSGFAQWTRFSAGMTVKLDCALDCARGWWRGLAERGSRAATCRPRACELFK